MGTRGLYGFRMNGQDKTTYNHYDSYPDWLGRNMAEFCENTKREELVDIFNRIELVREEGKPTPEQVSKYAQYCDDQVGKRTAEDWYCLLRNLQGYPEKLKEIEGTIHMIDYRSFIKDSLFCEYAYIINLDEDVLEYWVGFQHEPQAGNRYGTEANDGYYPCKLVGSFPLGTDADEAVQWMNEKG